MSPVDRQTIVLLMENLTANLQVHHVHKVSTSPSIFIICLLKEERNFVLTLCHRHFYWLLLTPQSPQIWNEQVRLLSQGLPNLVLEVKPWLSKVVKDVNIRVFRSTFVHRRSSSVNCIKEVVVHDMNCNWICDCTYVFTTSHCLP